MGGTAGSKGGARRLGQPDLPARRNDVGAVAQRWELCGAGGEGTTNPSCAGAATVPSDPDRARKGTSVVTLSLCFRHLWLDHGRTGHGSTDRGHDRICRPACRFHPIPASGPPAGPHNFHRGGDLGIYSAETVAAIAELADEIDGNVATAIWNEALSSHWVRPPVWVHGDIAPGNLLVADGQLVAVIDFGTAAIGDPACDLVIAWNFLHGEARARFRTALPLDDTTWQRARGWALWKALITTVDMRRSGAPALDGQRRILAVILSEKL